jgi:small subunit ribosomal protein S4
MARYIGPKRKIERKFGEPIFSNKLIERKKYPPGQHGANFRRKKNSDYALQLFEKQKVKYIYGILERQFIKMFKTVSKKKGITGELLIQLCESRLDNIVYRLGLAVSRAAARQLVNHRHVTVNKKIVNIPSYILKSGDVIGIKKKSINLLSIKNSIDNKASKLVDWLTWDNDNMCGVFQSIPIRKDIPENIKDHLIVELYSK